MLMKKKFNGFLFNKTRNVNDLFNKFKFATDNKKDI